MPRRAAETASTTSSNAVAKPTTVSPSLVWVSSMPLKPADRLDQHGGAAGHGGQAGQDQQQVAADSGPGPGRHGRAGGARSGLGLVVVVVEFTELAQGGGLAFGNPDQRHVGGVQADQQRALRSAEVAVPDQPYRDQPDGEGEQ